jgi:Arrestin (or S-antigen), C-terminal domain
MVFGPKADVQVSLDRDSVLPGETVEATIRILGGRKDLPIQEGRLELDYENEYMYRHEVGSGATRRTKESKAIDRDVLDSVRFLEAGHVAADTPYEATASLTVPADAVPSAEGEITKVRWRVVATLARPHAMDVHRRVPLIVLSQAGATLDAPDVETRDDVELSFRLEREHFGPGDSVQGALVATPLQACRMNELRVELVRREDVPRNERNTKEVEEGEAILQSDVSLSLGAPHEWPFQFQLPPVVVPCLKTEHSTVTWLLKGIGSRRLRRDYRVAQPIDVHSAPRV